MMNDFAIQILFFPERFHDELLEILRKQLKEGGLRSFGRPKKIGDYERST